MENYITQTCRRCWQRARRNKTGTRRSERVGNKYSPTVIAAAVTSKINKAKLPTHIELPSNVYGLQRDSVILLEQIRTLDKRRLKERIGELNETTMSQVNNAILISLGFAVK